MASSMVFTYESGQDGTGLFCNVKKLICTWTSDASGNASGSTAKVAGQLVKGVTVPGGGGNAPTNLYDITLTDEQAIDVLGNVQSNLQNRSSSSTQEVYFLVLDAAGTPLAQSVHPQVSNVLTVSVANAGNAKSGTIILYYRWF